VDMLYLLTLQN